MVYNSQCCSFITLTNTGVTQTCFMTLTLQFTHVVKNTFNRFHALVITEMQSTLHWLTIFTLCLFFQFSIMQLRRLHCSWIKHELTLMNTHERPCDCRSSNTVTFQMLSADSSTSDNVLVVSPPHPPPSPVLTCLSWSSHSFKSTETSSHRKPGHIPSCHCSIHHMLICRPGAPTWVTLVLRCVLHERVVH